MNYKIQEKSAFCVLEKVSAHTVADEKNKQTIPEFWAQCHKDGTVTRLLQAATDENVYGICYAPTKNCDTFDYSIAVVCQNDVEVPQDFRKSTIPARTWAVFECIGAMPNAIQEMWGKIESEFFATSGYRSTNEMDMEVYPDGDTDSPDYRCEIWVTVCKDS